MRSGSLQVKNFGFPQINTDYLTYSLKNHQGLGKNYIMNAIDFTESGTYFIESLSEADEKNYPHPYNPGYYYVVATSNDGWWQVLMLFSPRLASDTEIRFYVGRFVNGVFDGWNLFSST